MHFLRSIQYTVYNIGPNVEDIQYVTYSQLLFEKCSSNVDDEDRKEDITGSPDMILIR